MKFKKLPKTIRVLLIFGCATLAGITLVYIVNFYFESKDPSKSLELGVTLSVPYAQSFNQNPEELLKAIDQDLKIKKVRLPLYWNEIEKEQDSFDFSLYEKLLTYADQNDLEITLTIGDKVPRWPECHAPEWAKLLSQQEKEKRTLYFIEQTMKAVRQHSSIKDWQIENEGLFYFGVCSFPDPLFLEQEVRLARSLDNRPIILTDSGEVLGLWSPTAILGDKLGVSLYRTTWNPWYGYFTYPLTPWYYSVKAWIVSNILAPKTTVLISELQAEPWSAGRSLQDTPLDQQLEVFPVKQLQKNINFAASTNLSPIYLWGVEWWYDLKSKGHPEYWEYIKSLTAN